MRHIANSDDGKLELGLQALALKVNVIRLPGHGETRRGLFLHRMPAYGDRPGIIARPGHLASGHKIKLGAGESSRLLQIGRRLEAAEGYELFVLVPL